MPDESCWQKLSAHYCGVDADIDDIAAAIFRPGFLLRRWPWVSRSEAHRFDLFGRHPATSGAFDRIGAALTQRKIVFCCARHGTFDPHPQSLCSTRISHAPRWTAEIPRGCCTCRSHSRRCAWRAGSRVLQHGRHIGERLGGHARFRQRLHHGLIGSLTGLVLPAFVLGCLTCCRIGFALRVSSS